MTIAISQQLSSGDESSQIFLFLFPWIILAQIFGGFFEETWTCSGVFKVKSLTSLWKSES